MELSINLSDLEEFCTGCYETPGKRMSPEGKWVGNCPECNGLAKVPTELGDVLLQFFKRHKRRLADPDE